HGNVVVKYDIVKSKPGNVFNILIYFSDEYYTKLYYPENTFGDIGNKVSGGLNKTIIWDIKKDMNVISGNIIPNVLFANSNFEKNMGGPYNAFLSLAVPGLGDYFIADHKKMKFKPYYKTALSLGCITLGIISAQKRYREVYWSPPHIETIYVRHWTGTHWTFLHEDKLFPGRWVEGEMKNYLFPGDAETLIGVGAAIWLIDVFWVASKGKKNITNKKRLKAFSNFMDNTDFGYQAGYFQFNYAFKF
ncbi:hypothetical protein ACFLQ5_01875, partial [Bacteroidota bacterium]